MAKKGTAETPLMQQYYRIKEQHPDAILLFRLGDFYETFAQDAIATAEILGITLTRRGNGAAQFVELAGFPHHALDNYLPKLVRAGRRVAICDQLEDPKLTKKLVKRGITEIVTPGVVMGDSVLRTKENNYLAAVYAGGEDQGGLALLDISTGEFLCSEGALDHIDKLLESYQPKEVLMDRRQRISLERRLSFRGFIYDLDDWAFAYESARERLLSLLGTQSLKGYGVEHLSHAISASGAILAYMELTSHTRLGHVTSLRCIDRSGYMRLDAFTLRSLEILAPLSPEGHSLLNIMDTTRTPMGGRLLRQWLVFPLLDITAIHDRQAITRGLYDSPSLRVEIADRLASIGDLERLTAKAAVGRIGPREVNQLRHSLLAVEEIRTMTEVSSEVALVHLSEHLDSCPELCDLIEATLVPDAPLALGRGAVIGTGVDTELDELRQLSGKGKDYLSTIVAREIERTGIQSLKVAYNNVFGYYLEVRNTHKDRVPDDWIRKQTLVNAERYITAELKEYEERILGAEDRIAVIETRIYTELVERLSHYIQTIQQTSRTIARLDCLNAFAEVAKRYGYTCPDVVEHDRLIIRAGRHPVIERMLPTGVHYIPNDVALSPDEAQIMIITGPNMSGKSALLRQTALIALLAQVGSYVPAEYAEVGLVDSIFTRVGASDNISRGESTFMVEMQEASSILNNLTTRSLILFDELGRGTSTYDGISIAWSIVEYLHDNPVGRPKTLFATHYHELNDLEARLSRVRNYNVSAREIDGKMLFLRKLVPGGSEHSFGIQVAKLGGMPQPIVARASDILRQLEQQHGSGISSSVEESAERLGARVSDQPDDLPESLTGVQMSFFQLDDPVLSQIREMLLKVDINTLTPLEALNKLNDIKGVLKH